MCNDIHSPRADRDSLHSGFRRLLTAHHEAVEVSARQRKVLIMGVEGPDRRLMAVVGIGSGAEQTLLLPVPPEAQAATHSGNHHDDTPDTTSARHRLVEPCGSR